MERGFGSTTLEFEISFVQPITPRTGPVRADGTVLTIGRRIGTAEGRLTDAGGRLLVHATTTCLIFERLYYLATPADSPDIVVPPTQLAHGIGGAIGRIVVDDHEVLGAAGQRPCDLS